MHDPTKISTLTFPQLFSLASLASQKSPHRHHIAQHSTALPCSSIPAQSKTKLRLIKTRKEVVSGSQAPNRWHSGGRAYFAPEGKPGAHRRSSPEPLLLPFSPFIFLFLLLLSPPFAPFFPSLFLLPHLLSDQLQCLFLCISNINQSCTFTVSPQCKCTVNKHFGNET